MDAVQQLARPCEAVLERFQIDTRYIFAKGSLSFKGEIVKTIRDDKVWYDLVDEFGVRWSMPDDTHFIWILLTIHLLMLQLMILRNIHFQKVNDPTRFEGLREQALMLKERPAMPL